MKLNIINAQDEERTVEVPTDQELAEFEMHHDHAGNGWIMVENVDDEYCRVAYAGRGEVSPQAYLVWKPKLRVAMKVVEVEKGVFKTTNDPQRIRDNVKGAILALRWDLKTGRKKVESTWIK